MSRQYFSTPISELEEHVRRHADDSAMLGPIHEELTFRQTDRALRLRREVRALLDGTLKAPSAPPLAAGLQSAADVIAELPSQMADVSTGTELWETASIEASAVVPDEDQRLVHEPVPPLRESQTEVATADATPLSIPTFAPLGVEGLGSANAVPAEGEGAVTDNEDAEDTPLSPSLRAGVDIPFADALVGDALVPLEVARARQVFRFLRDFAERNVQIRRTLREQLWTLSLADLPSHPSIQVGTVTSAARADVETPNLEESEPLLRVRRPTLTPPPRAPASHTAWVRRQTDDPFTSPVLHAEIERARREDEHTGDEEADAQPVRERRDADPAREKSLQGWLASWELWAVEERPARKAMQVFEGLYALLGRIERESERVELILGDGRLRRSTTAGPVDHPVLLQRVELEFNPARLEFRVGDADRAPELYGAVLQGDDGISGQRLHELQQELERTGFHPLGADGTGGFLKRIAGLLGPTARFLEQAEPLARADVPTIRREPVLLLRIRSSGLPAAMTRVLEDLDDATEVPTGVQRVVGVDLPASWAEVDVGVDSSAAAGIASAVSDVMTAVGEPPDVLLAKPANLEQVQIARALKRHGAVLVQGPPGTGKSHTIANLIGHLVAQGNRVLVTSHTTKALRVLRQQVPEDLRPLCVTLLDQDLEGRTQLEEAVRGIVERVGSSDEGTLERDVARFADTRQRLMEATAKLHEELRGARVAEYEPVVVGGESFEPVTAARLAGDERERHEWLPTPLTSGAPLPLSIEELDALYATNGVLSSEEEREFEVELPPRDQVLGACAFADAVSALSLVEPAQNARFWERTPTEGDQTQLLELVDVIERFTEELRLMTPWQRALVAAGREGEAERDLWRKLQLQVSDASAGYKQSRDLLLDFVVERTPGTADGGIDTVAEIQQHLAEGGSLGKLTLTFRPRWKATLAAWRVNGAAPDQKSHCDAIVAWLQLEARRRTLGMRWERQAVPVGLPALTVLPEPPETALGEYAAQFDDLTRWWEIRWGDVTSRLATAGFRWPAFREMEVARAVPQSPFERDVAIATGPLLDFVSIRLGCVRRLKADRELADQAALLSGHRGVLAAALRDALIAHDTKAWSSAREELDAVGAKADAWQQRRKLLARLARDARAWADAIRGRTGIHARSTTPTGVAEAWRWRQVVQELERRAAIDEREVARQLERRRGELREVTRALIDRMAWLAQLRRTDGNARRALIGWSDTQKKIGKGTGKRVPELQAESRKLLSQARDAVPVWIMPLARVAESFDPRGRKFDVVIVDEASQSDVTGLLAFYLGKHVIVVGDHEQVSPSAVGQKLDEVQHLIAQHLIGVPNAHLYDGQTSIYDLARQSFGGSLALREHFRCVPDIVEFSNHLAYNGQMRPLRDPSTAVGPHVAEYVIPSAMYSANDGKVNLSEARAVAAIMAAMAELPEYAGKSFGTITLLGDEQSLQIQTILLSLLGADRLQERRFAAGNPAQFQGDERDIIVLSMVDRPSLTGRPLPLRDTAMFKQRYNVAVSRARDQLWLVHSLDPGRDLHAHDLRRRLIDHVRDPGAVRRAQAAAVLRAESPFEAAVIERLVSKGFQVTPQVEVGRYRIDMVIADGEARVALECDGDRFHPPEQIPEDIARQAVLERAGWRFIRLRGTRFYRDPEGSMAWVYEELTRLGVSPIQREAAPEESKAAGGLREVVVRRAWSIMQDRGWVPRAADESPADSAASEQVASPSVAG